MQRRTITLVALMLFTLPLCAKELIVPVSVEAAGANGTFFRTDIRIFNPSATNTIAVRSQFLPVNRDNNTAAIRTMNIAPRQMVWIDNFVADYFGATGLGALRFESSDDLVVTSRTYTDSPNTAAPGTLGQFVPAFESSGALTNGVVLQLSNSPDLSTGFRTNIGVMNPNDTPVTANFELHRPDGSLIRAGTTGPVPPLSVIQGGLSGGPGSLDSFANAYLTFNSPLPLFVYGSVVDNRSGDQVFLPALQDIGTSTTPPAGVSVTVHVGPGLVFNPASVNIRVGDTVVWSFDDPNIPHTTTSDLVTGPEVWDSHVFLGGTFSHRFTTAGDWEYYCEIHSSADGNQMNGVVHVESSGGSSGGGY